MFFIFLSLSLSEKVSAAGPFGGVIGVINPACDVIPGSIIYGAFHLGISYFYQPGVSFSFPYGPPSHSGQILLGLSGPPAICAIYVPWGIQVIGTGSFIIFHGSSI